MTHFEVMIIGGGTGGLRLALQAAKTHSTILFEPGAMGGTCLNTGCIPTKALLHAAHLFEQTKNLSEFGITATPKLNFTKLMGRMQGIVSFGREHAEQSVKKNDNLTLVKAKATFLGKDTVIANGKRYTASKIVIATGASNFVPPIPGLKNVEFLDNEKLMSLKKLPKSVTLIGGGYISMEFATFFRALGSKVTVLEAMPSILGMLDEDVRDVLQETYESKRITFHTNAKISDIAQKAGKITISFSIDDKKKTITSEALVVATGRKANTATLNLANAGVGISNRGAIEVNEFLQTSNPHIFAMGDCTTLPMFAHAVKRESKVILTNLAAKRIKDLQKTNLKIMPWVVFTNPNVAGVGLSEKQAIEQKKKFSIKKIPFKRVGRARIIGETEGFVKIIYEIKTNVILGAAIVGPSADTLLHEIVAVMNSKEPTMDVISRSIHAHPTLSEVFDF
jgi:pyruvate/2-oxoglutarate dehydrogenase complex dihydrolipoamide dehydrogenase (E3) component